MKKNIIQYITLIAFIAGLALPAVAQTTPADLKIVSQEVRKSGNNVLVDMALELDDVKVRSNDMIIYTPVLVSAANSNDRVELSPIVVAGNKRHKILRRELKLNKEMSVDTPANFVLKKVKRAQQGFSFSTAVPFSSWMEGATLVMETTVSGCADCKDVLDNILVANNVIPKLELPAFALTYIEPEAEVKARQDRHTATFNFVVDRYELLRDYKGNRPKFEEVDAIISEVALNGDIQITEFTIDGYASPEASVPHNKMLAENRAKAFADYLVSKFNIDRNKFTVNSHGEDWVGLRKAVVASNIADKDEILKIIDTVDNPDARDTPLQQLSGGTTYRTMLNEMYPPLRRTEYTIAYLVRAFNLEEAKEVLKTNPKLLSLNEMYMVAQSYDASSAEFKEVFDIASRLYPESDIAIINSSAADIENGAYDSAIRRLQKLGDSSKAYNNLAVAYLMKGDYDKARELFTKAGNDKDAKANLIKLAEFLK